MSMELTDAESLTPGMSVMDRSSFRRLMTVGEELGTEPSSQVSDSGSDGEGSSVVVTELVG